MPVGRLGRRQPHRRMVCFADRWRFELRYGARWMGSAVGAVLARTSVPMRLPTLREIEAWAVGGLIVLGMAAYAMPLI
jgi:hypothetical protein